MIDRATISEIYRNQQWALVPQLVPQLRLSRFRDDVLSAPSKRVTVGARHEYWTEYAISSKSSLGIFLKSRRVFALAQSAAGRRLSRETTIWAQSYRVGERIAWHRDKTGEIQFLLSVQSPDANAGGQFCLRVNKTETVLSLRDGDAILFKANALPHSTTRILGPASEAPQRVTAVARFFALAGSER